MKAYALTKAKKLGLPNRAFAELGRMIKGEIGHNGYYLDGDRVLRV